MTKRTKLTAGVAVALVAAGGGGAYAATSGGDGQQALINDAAHRLGVQPQQLHNALEQAFFDRLDAAVKAGRLTRAQADAIKQKVRQSGRLPFGGGHPFGGERFGFRARAFGLRAAAGYLGLTPAQLRSQMEGGKTLAQIAGARGKSVSGLEQALRDQIKQRLDKAVANGRLTSAQESRALARLSNLIDDVVHGRHPTPPAGFRGHGGFWGPGPAGGPPPGAMAPDMPPPAPPV